MANELAKLGIPTDLSKITKLPDVKRISACLAAVESVRKTAGATLDEINKYVEKRIWVLVRGGELLRLMAETGERTGGGDNNPSGSKLELEDLGLTNKESHRWQALARVPAEKLKEYVEKAVRTADRLTVEGAYRLSRVGTVTPTIEPPEGEYDLIYCDPPWRYDAQEAPNRSIENQYPTMPVDDICALKPPAAKNCALFLWATAPKLKEALAVIEAWGFTYKTHAIWDKQKIGLGYWFRGQHELLLVATRGKASPPEAAKRISSLFSYKRGKHSAKPKQVYAMIEAMLPKAKRIELFARDKRKGWDRWGHCE